MSPKTLLRKLTGASSDDYIGRHRAPEERDEPEASADWTPLAPGIRQHLAPTHYANRQLPAGVDEPTAHFDPAAVLAASTTQDEPATRSEVLAELRGDLDAQATAVIPAVTDLRGDLDAAAQANTAEIFTDVMTREQQ